MVNKGKAWNITSHDTMEQMSFQVQILGAGTCLKFVSVAPLLLDIGFFCAAVSHDVIFQNLLLCFHTASAVGMA